MIAALASALLLATPAAPALPPGGPTFGTAGQWVITADYALGPGMELGHGSGFRWTTRKSGDDAVTVLQIQPSLDHFVTDYVSVGGLLGYTQIGVGDAEAEGVARLWSLGARLGFMVPLNPRSCLWPRAQVTLVSDDDAEDDEDLVRFQLYVPLTTLVLPHFLAGFGPVYERDLRRDVDDGPRTTAYGLLVTFGGYW